MVLGSLPFIFYLSVSPIYIPIQRKKFLLSTFPIPSYLNEIFVTALILIYHSNEIVAGRYNNFVKSEVLQEFLPRAVSAYGDGLENGQLLQIPLVDNERPVMFSFFANITKGCDWSNVTL